MTGWAKKSGNWKPGRLSSVDKLLYYQYQYHQYKINHGAPYEGRVYDWLVNLDLSADAISD